MTSALFGNLRRLLRQRLVGDLVADLLTTVSHQPRFGSLIPITL
jgi:stress-induced morphogen